MGKVGRPKGFGARSDQDAANDPTPRDAVDTRKDSHSGQGGRLDVGGNRAPNLRGILRRREPWESYELAHEHDQALGNGACFSSGRLRWGSLWLPLLAVVHGLLPLCSAQHFRFAAISYRRIGESMDVVFRIESQWRRSFSRGDVFTGTGADGRAVTGDVVDIVGVQVTAEGAARPIVFETGDGGEYPVSLTVTHYSIEEDYIHGFSEIQHRFEQLNDGGNDWLASLRGCCRNFGPPESKFRVTLRVNLGYDAQALMTKALPVLPVHYDTALQAVQLFANSDGGQTKSSWRIGNGEELGDAVRPLPEQADFPDDATGVFVLNSSAFGIGFFPIVLQVASRRSVSPYDFLLRVIGAELRDYRPYFHGVPVQTNTSTGALQSAIPNITTFAGYEIFLTLTASTNRSNCSIREIRGYSLPIGAHMLDGTEAGQPGAHTMTIDFRWTPLVEQAGSHYVCVEAVDNSTETLSSGQHCFILWVNGVNPAPSFSAPPPNAIVTFYMEVPNEFAIAGTNENPYDNILLFPKFPLSPGQFLSPPVASEKKIRATDAVDRVAASAILSWRPSRFTGAFSERLCFVLSQDGGPGVIPQTSSRCITVRVERCKYMSQPGDTMQSIGALFASDWLSLWGINVNLTTFAPAAGTEIFVGRLYSLRAGDTLSSISRQFGTTVERIKELNVDVSKQGAEMELSAHAEICILPNTCFDD